MVVLTYKTSCVNSLLQKDIIENNLKETDKICDPRYIMSAGTAWLRYNQGKNLFDLQMKIKELGLNTVIIAKKIDGNYKLCLPGHSKVTDLSYVADFVSNPYIITQLPIRRPEEIEILKSTGYSCSTRYAAKLSTMNQPSTTEIENMDIHTQLQWASIKFNVEHVIVNPDEELNKDLKRAEDKGINIELKELTPLSAKKEKIYAHIDPKTEAYISAFGILEKTTENGYATSRLVIHLPTYLHELDEK